MDRLLVSEREARAALGIGRVGLQRLIADGHLETRQVGRRTLVTVASLTRYCAPQSEAPDPEPVFSDPIRAEFAALRRKYA